MAASCGAGGGDRGDRVWPARRRPMPMQRLWTCRWWTARQVSRSGLAARRTSVRRRTSPATRYGLRVTNHTDGRVLVVMSVDGVNILTGETAGYNQRGYVFAPHETYDVDGWRKTLTEVADFTFAPLPQSYAALTGRPGERRGDRHRRLQRERSPPVARARRRRTSAAPARQGRRCRARRSAPASPSAASPAPPPLPPARGRQDRATSPSRPKRRVVAGVGPTRGQRLHEPQPGAAAAEPRDEKLGTGHGAREWSVTIDVAFERATSYPQFTQADRLRHLRQPRRDAA